MKYEEKLKIANEHLESLGIPLEWDDLSDTNSLHDADTIEEIKSLAEERASEDGFNISGFEQEDENDYIHEDDFNE